MNPLRSPEELAEAILACREAEVPRASCRPVRVIRNLIAGIAFRVSLFFVLIELCIGLFVGERWNGDLRN